MGLFDNHPEIIGSWEMLEFVEKYDDVKYTPDNISVYRKMAEDLELGFRARNNEKVRELRKRTKDQFVYCGFVTNVETTSDGVIFDIKDIVGSSTSYFLSPEVIKKSGYTPAEGDRVTLMRDKSLSGKDQSDSRESFYFRKNGADIEIYNNHPDRLARKEQELNAVSAGLSGNEKDIARCKRYKKMLDYQQR